MKPALNVHILLYYIIYCPCVKQQQSSSFFPPSVVRGAVFSENTGSTRSLPTVQTHSEAFSIFLSAEWKNPTKDKQPCLFLP